jgi:hypothetical protein
MSEMKMNHRRSQRPATHALPDRINCLPAYQPAMRPGQPTAKATINPKQRPTVKGGD